MTNQEIEFRTEKRKIKDLIDCTYNPRTLSQKQRNQLLQSFKKFGYVEICAVNADNVIIAGHQRIHVMKHLGWEDREIEVRVPNRLLSKEEFDEYLIRSNLNKGSWDWDLLANDFDFDFLTDVGFEKDTLIENFHLDIQDADIEDVKEVNENCNFIIKCKNIDELNELKTTLGVQSTKIKCDDFLDIYEKYSDS